jgi:hypothetical protein
MHAWGTTVHHVRDREELPGPWVQIHSLRDPMNTCAAHISQMFEVVSVLTKNKKGEFAGDISTLL